MMGLIKQIARCALFTLLLFRGASSSAADSYAVGHMTRKDVESQIPGVVCKPYTDTGYDRHIDADTACVALEGATKGTYYLYDDTVHAVVVEADRQTADKVLDKVLDNIGRPPVANTQRDARGWTYGSVKLFVAPLTTPGQWAVIVTDDERYAHWVERASGLSSVSSAQAQMQTQAQPAEKTADGASEPRGLGRATGRHVAFNSSQDIANQDEVKRKTKLEKRVGRTYWVRPPSKSTVFSQFVTFLDSPGGYTDELHVTGTEKFTVVDLNLDSIARAYYLVRFADGTQKWLSSSDFEFHTYGVLGNDLANAEIFEEDPSIIERRVQAARKRQQAVQQAHTAKPGVSIGMTKEQVLSSRWGKPQHINSTHTAAGTTEQWVYGGGNYLYFRDGRLEAVQN